jgi:uncharacterized RDD family membrane protein YckC
VAGAADAAGTGAEAEASVQRAAVATAVAEPSPAVAAVAVAGPGQSLAAPDQAALAGPWRRLAAFAIDALILTLATGALWGRLLTSFANRMSNAATTVGNHGPAAHGAYGRVWAHTLGPYLIELTATIIVAIVYYWVLTGYWGTTIGKRALGCWVTEADGRSRVSLGRSFVRALVFVAGGELVPPFFVVDNVWLTADSRRQTLHDKAAGTLVVRRRPAR